MDLGTIKIIGAVCTAAGAIISGGANVADAIGKAKEQKNNSNQNEEE